MRTSGTFTTALRARIADRKSELLALLASDGPAVRGNELAGGRPLPQGAAARVEAIIAEIDETVLPRILVLRAGPKEIGSIAVSHRHVIAVDLPGRPAATQDAEAGAGALAPLFAVRLAEIAAVRADLVLTVARRRAKPGNAEPSCSLVALRGALAASTTRSAFDRLRDLVMTQAGAWLISRDAGQPPLFGGAAHWETSLTHLAETFRDRARAPAGAAAMGQPRAEGIAIPVSAQQLVLLARFDQQVLAVLLPLAFGLEAITAWQRGD